MTKFCNWLFNMSLARITHSGDGNMNVFPSRSVRTDRYKLIWNLHPEFLYKSHVTEVIEPNDYWRSWVEKAKHDPHAADVVGRYQHRIEYELYDLHADRSELDNLATDPAHRETLARLKSQLAQWMAHRQFLSSSSKRWVVPGTSPTASGEVRRRAK